MILLLVVKLLLKFGNNFNKKFSKSNGVRGKKLMKNVKEVYDIIEKYNEKLDIFYTKFNAGYFALIDVGITIISIILAYLLYTSVDPTFNMFSNWISDLGRGPNYSGLTFNSGMILSSFTMLLFQLYLIRDLHKRGGDKTLIKLAYISGSCASIGLFFIGVFPLSFSPILHGIAADTLFFGGMFGSLIYGILELKTPNMSKIQAIIGFITASVYGIYIAIAIGSLISPLFTQAITYFAEWLTLMFGTLWILAHGLYTIMVSTTGFRAFMKSLRRIIHWKK